MTHLAQLLSSATPMVVALLAALGVVAVLFPRLRNVVIALGAMVPALGLVVLWSLEIVGLIAGRHHGALLDHIAVEAGVTEFQLGAAELLQNHELNGSASLRHVGFRVRDGMWHVANVSATRRLSLAYVSAAEPTKPVTFFSNRQPLATGDVLELATIDGGRKILRVTESTADSLILETEGGQPSRIRVTADRTVEMNHLALPRCQVESGDTSVQRVGLLWARLATALRRSPNEKDILRLGGTVSCATRAHATAAVERVVFDAVQIVHVDRIGFAAVARGDRSAVVVRNGRRLSLELVEQPAVLRPASGGEFVLQSFIAGHTRHGIRCDAEHLGWCRGEIGRGGFQIAPLDDIQRLRDKTPNEAMAAQPQDPDGTHVIVRAAATCRMAGEPPGNRASATGAPLSARPACPGLLLPSYAYSSVGVGLFVGLGLLLFPYSIFLKWGWGRQWFERHLAVAFTERLLRSAAVGGAVAIALYGLQLHVHGHGVLRQAPIAPWFAIGTFALALVAVATARGAGLAEGVLMFFFTGLVAFGHVSAMALSLELDDLRHLRFVDDSTLAITLTAAAVIMVSQFSPRSLAFGFRLLAARGPTRSDESSTPQRRGLVARHLQGREGFVALLTVIAIVFAVWVGSGTETGIAGFFQPSEVTKSLLVLLIGVAVTRALDEERAIDRYRPPPHRPLSLRQRFGIGTAAAIAGVGLTIFSLGWVGSMMLGLMALPAVGAGLWVLVFRTPPTLAAFVSTAIMLALILLAPIVQHDLSPFLVMFSTAVLTMLLAVALHRVAQRTDRHLLPRQAVAPLKLSLRPPIPKLGWVEKAESVVVAWIGRKGRRFLSLPEFWMFLVPLLVASVAVYGGRWALEDATASRTALIEYMHGGLMKPAGRIVSWVEFNGKPPADGPLAMEFVDIGLQVDRSRKIIRSATCRSAMTSPEEEKLNEVARSRLPTSTADLASSLQTRVWAFGSEVGGVDCASGVDGARLREQASLIPVVQSDFVGTWLIAVFGRDGAIVIAIFQFGMITALIGTAFLTMRWSPGHRFDRPTASAAAYTCLGFAAMLAMQWAISWSNALGVVPVMGQPATYLSHGRSHFLGFGLPVVLAALASLRLRRTMAQFRQPQFDRSAPAVPGTTLLQALSLTLKRKILGRS